MLPGGPIVPLKTAIATTPIDAQSYLADIPLDHCYLKSNAPPF